MQKRVAQTEPSRTPVEETAPQSELKPIHKVLLIDDSDSWCKAVTEELDKAGIGVIRFRDYKEALAEITSERPFLVMVDLLVATRAGAGFVRRLRSLPWLKNIPLLLTTVGTAPQAVFQAVGASSNEVVSKNKSTIEGLAERLKSLPASA